MVLVLSGDCGGTNTRLSLWDIKAVVSSKNNEDDQSSKPIPIFAKKYENHVFSCFVSICHEFLLEASSLIGNNSSVTVCVLACAGPILHNSVTFTNVESGWEIVGLDLQRELGIPTVQLINDFQAMGYGLLTLESHEYHVLNDAPRNRAGPVATIGAGTGLGECFLTPDETGEYYTCYATEGGHVDFAPVDDLEVELLMYLKKKFKSSSRISAERIISGIGLSNVYEFLSVFKYPSRANAEIQEEWEGAGAMRGAVVGKYASQDDVCGQAMMIFVRAYGREAGNAALKYLPTGGFYITGGLAPKNLDFFINSHDFTNAFFDKGRVSSALKAVPIYLVLTEELGERGAHYCAKQLLLKRTKPSAATWCNNNVDKNALFTNGVQVAGLVSLGAIAFSLLQRAFK